MKAIYKNIFVLFSAFSLFVSCEGMLDKFPLDKLSSATFLSNETEMQTYTNGLYTMLPDAGALYGSESDEMIGTNLSLALWGGRTMLGIDCSGLVQVVLKSCGVSVLRDASLQAKQGDDVSFENRTAGDLAFFKNDKGNIVHVGIVMDNGEIIHSSGKVRIDKLDSKGIINIETGEYSHILSHLKRVKNL